MNWAPGQKSAAPDLCSPRTSARPFTRMGLSIYVAHVYQLLQTFVDLQASLAQTAEIASNLKPARELNDIRDARISEVLQTSRTSKLPRRKN